MNDVLKRITEELSKQRYKDKDLCDYVGISQSTFSTWKSKDRQPKPDQLPLIAEFLGVTLDYLMTGQEEIIHPSSKPLDSGLTDAVSMYEKFEKLLKSQGITPYRVHKDTGISTATLSDWKNGKSTPKKDKIKIICNYFSVPLSYFYGDDESQDGTKKYYLDDDTAQAAQEIFENKELRLLFSAARDSSPEDLKTARDILLALKRKEKGADE